MVDPMGSDGMQDGDSPRVLSRDDRRKQGLNGNKGVPVSKDLDSSKQGEDIDPLLEEVDPEASLYDLDWDRVKSGSGSEGDVFSERSQVPNEGGSLPEDTVEAQGDTVEDDFDLLDLPAPLRDPEVYDEFESVVGADLGTEGLGSLDDSVGEVAVESNPDVGWDIVFPEGEAPRLVIRAALLTDDVEDDAEVPVVESSVELSAEDVDNLLKLVGKVERYHSKESRFGRRVFNWAMRRKFFAGLTFAILMYLGISEIVNAFT